MHARVHRRALPAAVAALAVALAGCGGGGHSGGATTASKNTAGRQFSNPARVDNRWLPLRPGTEYVYTGTARDDSGHVVPHRVLFYVTDRTKLIDGVETRVLWDRDIYGGRLKEDELTFWAQDDGGTVWNFGEYPEEIENGRVTGAPDTWIAGLRGARAGINMPAHPRVGTGSYLQGFAPTINFADRAKAWKAGVRTCVPTGCYRHVLVTEEWAPGERGAHQLKYYAPGVGNVRVGYKGRVTDAERLVLAHVVRLGAKARAAVSEAVDRADRRGYSVSPKVYGRTQRAR